MDVAAYVAIGVVAWILGTVTWLMFAGVGQRIVLELRRDLFEHLTSLSLRYFSQQKAGWIIARLTSDVDALSDVLNQGLTTLVVNSLTLVAAIGGLFLLDWRLGLVALLVLPPGMLITRWFQRRSHEAFADVRTRIASVTAQLAESVSGMAVVQAFGRERAFQREFEDLNGGQPHLQHVRAEGLLRLLPRDRAARRARAGGRHLRGRADDPGRRARDWHPHRRRRDALARLPAAPGAVRALRAGAGGKRGDGEDLDRPRRRARHHGPSRRERHAPHRRAGRARRRRLRLREGARAPRARHRDPRGRLHRARRGVGGREVDDRQARSALLRPRPRSDTGRRSRPP